MGSSVATHAKILSKYKEIEKRLLGEFEKALDKSSKESMRACVGSF
jgi:hypothetical protein